MPPLTNPLGIEYTKHRTIVTAHSVGIDNIFTKCSYEF